MSTPNEMLAQLVLSSYNKLRFGGKGITQHNNFEMIMITLVDVLNTSLPPDICEALKEAAEEEVVVATPKVDSKSSSAGSSSHNNNNNNNAPAPAYKRKVPRTISQRTFCRHFEGSVHHMEKALSIEAESTAGATGKVDLSTEQPTLLVVPSIYHDKPTTIYNRIDRVLEIFIGFIKTQKPHREAYAALKSDRNNNEPIFVPREVRIVLQWVAKVWRPHQMLPDLTLGVNLWLKDLIENRHLVHQFVAELINQPNANHDLLLPMIRHQRRFEAGYTFLKDYFGLLSIPRMPSQRLDILACTKQLFVEAAETIGKDRSNNNYSHYRGMLEAYSRWMKMITDYNREVLNKKNQIKWPEGNALEYGTSEVCKFVADNFPACSQKLRDFINNNEINGESIDKVLPEEVFEGQDVATFREIKERFRTRIFLQSRKNDIWCFAPPSDSADQRRKRLRDY